MSVRGLLVFFLFLSVLQTNVFAHDDVSLHSGRFLENKGQWDERILYSAEFPGCYILVQSQQITYLLYEADKYSAYMEHMHDHGLDSTINNKDYKAHVYQVKFNNSLPNSKLDGYDEYPEKYNFLLGSDTSKWGKNINAYNRIYWNNLYEGIDLELFFTTTGLKYNFIVSAGASTQQIEMEYEGLNDMKFRKDGSLDLVTNVGIVKEANPETFWKNNDIIKPLRSSYQIEGNKVKFKVNKRKVKQGNIIIDPALIFSTNSGSLVDNWGNTACLDESGSLYTAGSVFLRNGVGQLLPNGFPVTPGAYQLTFRGGDTDMGIIKFDSSGRRAEYITYLGGNDSDVPISAVAAENGDLYILGVTGSSNFPTGNIPGHNNLFQGGIYSDPIGGVRFFFGTDIVVCKLRADGAALLGSTYLGGTGNDGLMAFNNVLTNNYGDQFRGDIFLDESENVYLASMTSSDDISIQNGFQIAYGGGPSDAYIARLTSDLQLVWDSYLGGDSSDASFSVQLGELGNMYVGGGTASENFPTTPDVINPMFLGQVDGFVTRVDQDGSNIVQSTFVGTNRFDQNYFIQMDDQNNVYLLGQTKGQYPILNANYWNLNTGLFVDKLTPDLSTRRFSTTIGSQNSNPNNIIPNISPTAFLVNECENIFICGWGGRTNNISSKYNGGSTFNMPITDGAYQTTTDGSDFYLMVLEKDINSLIYATYFGGAISAEHVDGGTSRFDKNGIVYQAVCSSCGGNNDFPQFPEKDGIPFSFPRDNLSGNCSHGVFKFDLSMLVADFEIDNRICFNKDVVFYNTSIGGKEYYWNFGDGNQYFTTDRDTPVEHRYEKAGYYDVSLIATDITTCTRGDTVTARVLIADSVIAYKDTIICPGESVMLIAKEGLNPVWQDNEALSCTVCDTTFATPTQPTYFYVESVVEEGCASAAEVLVDLYPEPAPVLAIIDSLPRCILYPAKFKYEISNNDCECCEPVIGVSWIFPDGTTIEGEEVYHTFTSFGLNEVILKVLAHDTLTISKQVYINSADSCLKNIFIPNTFTPNGDGVNDKVYVRAVNITELDFRLYNRWGEELFSTNTLSEGWDGIYKGQKLTQQVFVYTCSVIFWDGEKRELEGNITLVE